MFVNDLMMFSGDLLVIVEYCCHGNVQQFLLHRRSLFLNQVNPLTGAYEPNAKRGFGRKISGMSTHSSVFANGHHRYVD